MIWHKLSSDLFVSMAYGICAVVRAVDGGWEWFTCDDSDGVVGSGECDDLETAQAEAEISLGDCF